MYINYYELKKLVIELFEKYNSNDIKGLFNCIDKCLFLESILNNVEILVDNDTYNLFFTDNYIGSMKSDLYYDTKNNKTKLNILKYILYKEPNLVLNLLTDLININNYILKNDDNASIKIKRDVSNVEDLEELNQNISKINCDIYYHIYSDSILVGAFKYNGYFYISNSDSIKLDDDIEIQDKNILLNDMYYYNNLYLKNTVLNNSNKCKNLVK